MAKKSIPKKLKGVPTDAVYDPVDQQWELGKRDSKGNRVGAWTYWWPSTGHLCCEAMISDGGKREVFKRYHPDGTISHDGVTQSGFPVPGTVYILQRSKNKTTELALTTEPSYKAVFRMEQIVISKTVSRWRNFDAKGRRISLEGDLLHTVDAKKYASKNFGSLGVPKALEKLIEFQNDFGSENFAQGFVVDVDDKGLLKAFCNVDGKPVARDKQRAMLDALVPIAAATGTGSWYFLWNNGAKRAEDMPVVAFGDEGGYHVVAENLAQLLQIVGADVEPMIDLDSVSYYRGGDEEPSDQIGAYRNWLKTELGLAYIAKPDRIVKQAQAKYEKAFQSWMKTFF